MDNYEPYANITSVFFEDIARAADWSACLRYMPPVAYPSIAPIDPFLVGLNAPLIAVRSKTASLAALWFAVRRESIAADRQRAEVGHRPGGLGACATASSVTESLRVPGRGRDTDGSISEHR